MESNKIEQNLVPEEENAEKSTENTVIKSLLEDWSDLNDDFTQLQLSLLNSIEPRHEKPVFRIFDQEDHEHYKKKLEEMVSLQKKCLGGIAHQRYRMKKMTDAYKEAGKLSTEDSAILKDLSSKMQKRKNKFRDLEDVLPHKHGIYLSIILGEVNISLLNKEDKLKDKAEDS